jgi:hypothetical protein
VSLLKLIMWRKGSLGLTNHVNASILFCIRSYSAIDTCTYVCWLMSKSHGSIFCGVFYMEKGCILVFIVIVLFFLRSTLHFLFLSSLWHLSNTSINQASGNSNRFHRCNILDVYSSFGETIVQGRDLSSCHALSCCAYTCCHSSYNLALLCRIPLEIPVVLYC